MSRWNDETMERLFLQSIDALVDHHIDTEGRPSIDEALGKVPQHRVGYLAYWRHTKARYRQPYASNEHEARCISPERLFHTVFDLKK